MGKQYVATLVVNSEVLRVTNISFLSEVSWQYHVRYSYNFILTILLIHDNNIIISKR